MLVCIVISIDYADLLAATLPYNRSLFDHVYVVTEERDAATLNVCAAHDCTVLLTTETKARCGDRDASFNRAGLLHQAQLYVHAAHPDAWIALLDADIVLPSQLAALDRSTWNTAFLYGLARCECETLEEWEGGVVKERPYGEDPGNTIYGYFQLYHDKTKMNAVWSENAGYCDIEFSDQFGSNRAKVPSADPLGCIHLGYGTTDWRGRVSPRWGAGQTSKN